MHVDADGSIVSSGSMMPLTDSGSEAFPFSGRLLSSSISLSNSEEFCDRRGYLLFTL